MLDRIAEEGGADLVPALTSPLPFTVIADMLGAPTTDHERIRELSGTIVRSLEPVADPAVMQEIENADGLHHLRELPHVSPPDSITGPSTAHAARTSSRLGCWPGRTARCYLAGLTGQDSSEWVVRESLSGSAVA
ncbi:hypothetical protein ABZ078_36820 [Streptomyces sp. NPDC006385]|uniref:hypothetical protein n=1 Tax=Streptomyces sp. NPDC006385 TaxID=3156761 RepID=UPI0033B81B70